MKLKLLQTIIRGDITLKKDTEYEIDTDQPIVNNEWEIKIPMKQKGKFRYALIKDDEAILVD